MNNIPIFCACNEDYAPFASIMMKSVLQNTKQFINFYVMEDGLKSETKALILKDLKKYQNKTVEFVDMSKFHYDFLDGFRWPSIAFARLFISAIKPNLKKAIYLDDDIIVTKDIQELYNQDLGHYPIGAVPEEKYWGTSNIRIIRDIWPKYKKTSLFFNSGVLLLNIPKLIQMDFVSKALKLIKKLYPKLGWPDQDILNVIFENNYKQLDYIYNVFPHRISLFFKKYSNIKNIDPTIIHYVTLKPWKEHNIFQCHFEKVLKTSVFYPFILKRYRTQKILKYYLFGFIPILKKRIQKDFITK